VAFVIAKRYLRRRYGRARMTIWEDDADDAAQDAGTAHGETDMPPPHYQHVFPYVSGAIASTIDTTATAGAGEPARGPRSPKQSRRGALSSLLSRGATLPPTEAVLASTATPHEEKGAMS
jgi:hypothetical protein